ncbi:MAG: NRDE family protein [Acetobacteraceae bacterium]
MCTVVLMIRSEHPWPLMLASNRDERLDRAWDPPAGWWPDRPGVVAGRDRSGGGTWMGVNRHRVVATVLNRRGSLGPAPGKRSRGELPLLALEHVTAEAAADAIAALNGAQWRSFNMVVADATGAAFFLRGLGAGRPEAIPLAAGLHMITSRDPGDLTSQRVARHLPRFRAAPPPDADDWSAWRAILTDRSGPAAEQINVVPRGGYATICSSLLGLAKQGAPVWRFASTPPDATTYGIVNLQAAWG